MEICEPFTIERDFAPNQYLLEIQFLGMRDGNPRIGSRKKNGFNISGFGVCVYILIFNN